MGFFKAVAFAWPSIYNEAENKFYPGAIALLEKCIKNKTKFVIFSAYKENDPQPEIKQLLKDNKITVKDDHVIWAQSASDDEVKTEVLNQSSFDPTRTFFNLSDSELFYSDNRKKLVEMVEKMQNSEKKNRALIGAAIVLVPLLLITGGLGIAYFASSAAAAWITFIGTQILNKLTLPWTIVIGVCGTIFTTSVSALLGSMTVINDPATVEEAKQPLLGNTHKQVKKELLKENKNSIALTTNSDKKRLERIDGKENDNKGDKTVRQRSSASVKPTTPLVPVTQLSPRVKSL